MSPRLSFALQTATEAAEGTLAHFRDRVGFELKGDESPVTVADKEAERLIRERIARAYPGEEVYGEEEGGSQAPDRWVIDPIDGTKSFIAGVPLYATLLSYERAGVPILGVCVLPAIGEVVYAEMGKGAFLNGNPCRVSSEVRLSHSIVSTGGYQSLQVSGKLDAVLRLSERALAARGWTDAYGHFLVATGRIQAMIDPVVKHWDLSAVSLIVEEAGGSFTDFAGRPGIYSEAVSCSPGVKEAVLAALAE